MLCIKNKKCLTEKQIHFLRPFELKFFMTKDLFDIITFFSNYFCVFFYL